MKKIAINSSNYVFKSNVNFPWNRKIVPVNQVWLLNQVLLNQEKSTKQDKGLQNFVFYVSWLLNQKCCLNRCR